MENGEMKERVFELLLKLTPAQLGDFLLQLAALAYQNEVKTLVNDLATRDGFNARIFD